MSETNYDKIKHLVEVEDDILAVFTVLSAKDNHIENLSIAKNANITKVFIHNIYANLQVNFRDVEASTEVSNIVGRLKWKINEYDQIRTLIIYEKDRAAIVLIKSDTSLHETVDNILGYYYEAESPPKSLF